MIRMLTASTMEIDEIDLAVSEILQQLNLSENLLSNSLGILNCHEDFMISGVLNALCEKLPFPVIGNTTAGNAVPNQASTLQLCISVLTSDKLEFETVLQDGITVSNAVAPIQSGYQSAFNKRNDTPALVYAILPFFEDLGAEVLAKALFDVVGDVPVYGGITCNHTISTEGASTFLNGQVHQDAAVFALIYGDIKPRFIYSAFPKEKYQLYSGLVTQAQGHVVNTINDKPAEEYMKHIGLTEHGGLDDELIKTIALSVDYQDGTEQVVRAILNFTNDGSMTCCGIIPQGASISVGMIDRDEVLQTARKTLNEETTKYATTGLIAVSCMARELALGLDSTAELELLDEVTCGKYPFHGYYSAGEICPQYTSDGKTINRFHNFTFTACVF